jgi:hypothetical protein
MLIFFSLESYARASRPLCLTLFPVTPMGSAIHRCQNPDPLWLMLVIPSLSVCGLSALLSPVFWVCLKKLSHVRCATLL